MESLIAQDTRIVDAIEPGLPPPTSEPSLFCEVAILSSLLA